MGNDWLDRDLYPFVGRDVPLPGGSRMHVLDAGSGPPVLLVHGTPSWSFEWRHIVAGLSSGFRCIAPDHLGFGLSDRPADADYTPEAHADRLRDLVASLDVRGITLVVHDFGGLIGLPLALGPGSPVRRLVVINSWMWHLGEDPRVARIARLLGGRAGRLAYERLNLSIRVLMPGAYADRKKLTPAIHRHYLAPFADRRSRGLVLWPMARALLGSAAHANRLWESRWALAGIPALIIWGTRDPALGAHQLQRWREALPSARVVELPVGHWPHEESPEAVLTPLREFLEADA